jgi:hypothetical protein
MNEPRSLYRYACECSKRSCGETMELRRDEYERLSAKGAVRHRACARGLRVLARSGEAVAVRTTGQGYLLSEAPR